MGTMPIIRRTENQGVVTEEVEYPDGRKDVKITVNCIHVDAMPGALGGSKDDNYAQQIAREILAKHGGQMRVEDFQREFNAEYKRRGGL